MNGHSSIFIMCLQLIFYLKLYTHPLRSSDFVRPVYFVVHDQSDSVLCSVALPVSRLEPFLIKTSEVFSHALVICRHFIKLSFTIKEVTSSKFNRNLQNYKRNGVQRAAKRG